jgi:MSHA biogenesis protein MshK
MAESLKRVLLGLALLSCLTAKTAGAENLPDPTRPSTYAGGAEPMNTGPVLQSVMISTGRREAIISGKTVRVGDKVGDARVIKIGETEVVLGKGKELQTLKLFPGIEKGPASGGFAAKAR